MTTTQHISDLPEHRQTLAFSIISQADLPTAEDSAIRSAKHDFTEGVGWGLALTLTKIRGCSFEEAQAALR